MAVPVIAMPEVPSDLERFVTLLWRPGDVREVRIPTPGRTDSGYFDSPASLVAAVGSLDGRQNLYLTVNPVAPELLSPSGNRIKPRVRSTTADAQIVERRWLPIDIDPRRASGTSASDAEREAALEVTRRVWTYLAGLGWPEPVTAMSGNGYWLLYPIELPNDAASKAIVDGVLAHLAARFGTDRVSIDTTVSNASRIVAMIGTLKVKGDATADRPHRRSGLLRGRPSSCRSDRAARRARAAAAASRRRDPVAGDRMPAGWVGALLDAAGDRVPRAVSAASTPGTASRAARSIPTTTRAATAASARTPRARRSGTASTTGARARAGRTSRRRSGWSRHRPRPAGTARGEAARVAGPPDRRGRPARARPRADPLDRARAHPRGDDDPRRAAQGRQVLPRLPDRGRGVDRGRRARASRDAGQRAVPRARGRQAARAAAAPGGPGGSDDAARPARGAVGCAGRIGAGLEEDIREWLDGHPDAVMVAVDTLGKVRPAGDGRRNAYEVDVAAMNELQNLFRDRPVGLVIVHHARKESTDDFLASVSGTYGITGSADTIVVIRRKRNEAFGTIHVTGRDVADEEIPARFDELTWTAAPGALSAASFERTEVYRVIEERGPIFPQAIADLIGKTPPERPEHGRPARRDGRWRARGRATWSSAWLSTRR